MTETPKQERTQAAGAASDCNDLLGVIDSGDHVLHRPSGEEWLVGVVHNGYVYPLGWPAGRAPVSDCEVQKKATPEDRLMWLRDLARKRDAEWARDDRHRIAKEQLAMTLNTLAQRHLRAGEDWRSQTEPACKCPTGAHC